MSVPQRQPSRRHATRLLASALVFLFMWTACMGTSGAQVAAPVLAILQINDANYPEVRVAVAAADANGVALAGLDATQFVVTQNNQPVDITDVAEVTDGIPLSIVLALDVGRNMAGAPLQAATQAAQSLVDKLTPVDQVALLKFRGDVTLAAPLSTNHLIISQALQTLRGEGQTRLYDGAYEAVKLLENAPPGRRAVVLFTDGMDSGSKLTLDDAVEQAQRFAVPFYVIGYGAKINDVVLARLAQRTGGMYALAPRTENIPAAFEQVLADLRRAYQITYTANTPADDKVHELRVTLTSPGGSAQTSGRVTARSGNLSVALKLDGLPDRVLAEQVWQALGQPALAPDIVLISRQALMAPQITGPGQLVRMVIALDGNPLSEATMAPFDYTWDALNTTPGLHELMVTAEDHVGNRASATGQVAVIPPAYVAFVQPAENTNLVGVVPVTLAVSSVEGEQGLAVKVDDREVGRITSAPYTLSWDLRREAEGSHRLTAELATASGYLATAERAVTIGPHVVVQIEAPAANANLTGDVEIRAAVTSDAPVAEVVFRVAGREVGKVTSGDYRVTYHTGDFPAGEHAVQVEARNTMGMTGQAEVNVQMRPAMRSGALMLALVLGLLLMLVVPIALLARRRRVGRATVAPGAPAATLPVEQRRPIAWLIRTSGETSEQNYPLYIGENRIGRHRNFADIWLPDTTVSRRQAILILDAGGATLQNLNAENPCSVNGHVTDGERRLQNSDVIQIGEITFEFRFVQGG